MLGGERSQSELLPGLLPSPTGSLSPGEVECLWSVVIAIHTQWGSSEIAPEHSRSQWLEFLTLRTSTEPSYLEEYRNAVLVLEELRRVHGTEAFPKLLLESGVNPSGPATTGLAHLKIFVVNEFIRVWLATGGFKTYGAANYNGFVSGSRFAVRPSYRHHETTVTPSGVGAAEHHEER